MTALAPTGLSLAGPSQPPSQASSPASPTANFSQSQQAALAVAAAKSIRVASSSGASRPSTPVSTNVNGLNGASSGSGVSPGGPSLEPPQGIPFVDFLSSWGDAHVARWLAQLDPHGKCVAHAPAFRAADIRGSVLLELDQSSLKEIGLTSIGDRIRILNAVKALRLKCSARHSNTVTIANGHTQGSSVSSIGSANGAHPSPKLTVTNTELQEFQRAQSPQSAHAHLQQQPHQQHHRSRSRPAPLQLRNAAQSDLPRLIRDPVPSGPDSARTQVSTPLRPLPMPNGQASTVSTPVGMHSSHSSSAGSGSGSSRQHLPPLPPPPRMQPPLPPNSGTPSRGQPSRVIALQGRRTPTQAEPPHYALPPVPSSSQSQSQNTPSSSQQQLTQTPTQSQHPVLLTPGPSTGSTSGWKGEYGLPSGPRSGPISANSNSSGSGSSVGRATSPLPPNYGRRSPGGAHTKSPSYSISGSAASVKTGPRPNTTGGHPYATNGGTTSLGGSDTLQPPSQSSGNGGNGNAANLALSPIAESFISQGLSTPLPSSTTSTNTNTGSLTAGCSQSLGVNTSSNPNASAYHIGRGLRPSTPSSSQANSSNNSSSGAPSLDDLRRKLVKFLLAENGHSVSVTINVAECNSGVEILERVLRKFGKLGLNNSTDDCVLSDDGGLSIDGWSVYLDWDEGPAKPLREAELLSLCSAGADHPVREHGLSVRRSGTTSSKQKRSKALQQIFGDGPLYSPQQQQQMSTSTGDDDQLLGNSVQFPRTLTPSQEREREREVRNMKRASSISVLSGLGVRDPERILDSTTPSNNGNNTNASSSSTEKASAKSPSTSSFAGKMRAFLGQRPPSELIATHLPAYFPYTQPKVLRRTVRQSMRFSSGAGNRDSALSVQQFTSGSSGSRRASRRVSTATTSTGGRISMDGRRSSLASMASLPPPPVPEKPEMRKGLDVDRSEVLMPRMSISTEDGRTASIENEDEEKVEEKTPSTPHLLPPVTFPSESFADSFHSVTGGGVTTSAPSAAAASGMASTSALPNGARTGPNPLISRTASNASRRFSYMSELRARRDRSDTASMLTVDEITAEVENRRKSTVASIRSTESGAAVPPPYLGGGESDEISIANADEDATLNEEDENYEIIDGEEGKMIEDEDEEEDDDTLDDDDDDDDDDEEDEEDEEETLADEDGDVPVKGIGGKRGTKWIRGALIGAGSFGSVYLGMDAMNGQLMAVKQVELPSGSGPNEQRKKSMLEALEREIDLLRELQHENIVQYLDSSTDDKHLNIFLEYVPGGSVTALLRNYGAFEEALCRHFVRQILRGLDYLHSRDIIHRDIKGANILVDNKGGIKISDFGISKKVEETFGGNRAHRPSLQGSVFWMAPEVVKQVAHTRKADIWSVGCLVVEMLTGNHPYPTLNQMQAIFKIGMSAKPEIPPDISPEAEDFLKRTFETRHEERPDADELLLHAWIVNGPNSGGGANTTANANASAATTGAGATGTTAKSGTKNKSGKNS